MKYPVNRNGLAVPVEEVGYDVVPFQRRQTNRHHMPWSRQAYSDSSLHQIFRGLADRVVDLRIEQHDNLHDRFSAPRMPSEVAMIDCVEEYLSLNGVIDVVCERKTHQLYQVGPDRWDLIKGGFREQAFTAGSSRPYQFAVL